MLFSKQLIYPFEPLSLICLISWQLFQLFEPFASTDKKSHFLLLSEINGFDFLLESSKFSWSAALMVITLSSVPLRLPNIQLSISQFLLVIHDSLKSNSAFPESLKINFIDRFLLQLFGQLNACFFFLTDTENSVVKAISKQTKTKHLLFFLIQNYNRTDLYVKTWFLLFLQFAYTG